VALKTNYKTSPKELLFKPLTEDKKRTLKEEILEYEKRFDEEHKDVKCCFWGCELWSDCSSGKCHGTVYDHVEICGSWWYGFGYACDERDGNLDDRS
jgi:hypothetical protein